MMTRDDDLKKSCIFCYTKKCEVWKEILSKYRYNEDILILVEKIASQCKSFTSHQDEIDRMNANILNNAFSTTKKEPVIHEGEAAYIVGQNLYDRIKKLENKVESVLNTKKENEKSCNSCIHIGNCGKVGQGTRFFIDQMSLDFNSILKILGNNCKAYIKKEEL